MPESRNSKDFMFDISTKPIHIFLDFNAVIVNLDSLPLEKQKMCINSIEENIKELKIYLKQNIQEKEDIPEIPANGMAVFAATVCFSRSNRKWINSVKAKFLIAWLRA